MSEQRERWADGACLRVCVWWETKFNLFYVIVEYIENMLVLREKAGMSERSEQLVGGQILENNPANGGQPLLVLP